jgi:hypothetical protein
VVAELPVTEDGGTIPTWGESRIYRAGRESGRARQLTSQAKP